MASFGFVTPSLPRKPLWRPAEGATCCVATGPKPARTSGAQVRELWSRFNTGKFSSAIYLFADDAVYYDTLYPQPFKGRGAIERHFLNMEDAFEDGLKYVIDDLAESEFSVGCRWHVELESGAPLPFARGASTYKLRDVEGELLLEEAWDFPEPTFKVASVILPLLSTAVKLLRLFPGLLRTPSEKSAH